MIDSTKAFIRIIILTCCIFSLSSCALIKKNKLWLKGEMDPINEVVSFPFEERSGMIFLEVTINGRNYDFLLDTGAPNVLDQSVVDELGIKSYRFGAVGDAYGRRSQLDFTTTKTFEIGPLKYEKIGALISDFKSVPSFNCMGIDGLIGSNLMKKAVWQFDFEKKEISVAPSARSFDLSNANELSFYQAGTGTPKTTLQLGQKKVEGVTIDFGSGNGVTLRHDFIPESVVNDTIVQSLGSAGVGLYGVQNDMVNYLGTDSLKVGTDDYIPAVLRSRSKTGGLLGLRYWKNFLVTIDWQQQKLFFEPQKAKHLRSKSFGFGLAKKQDGTIWVNSLSTPSAASEKGLALGDQILEINGEDCSTLEYCAILTKLGEVENLQLKFKGEDGAKEITLIKRDNFAAFYDAQN